MRKEDVHDDNIIYEQNITSILGTPEKKQERVYYFLYDNKESDKETLTKISGMAESSFANFVSADKDIIVARKEGKKVFYGISKELIENLDLRLKQKLEQIGREEKLRELQEAEEMSQEELLREVKEASGDKSVITPEGLDLRELQELYPKVFEALETRPEETIQNFSIALEEIGFMQPLRFLNYTEVFNPKPIDHLRSKHLDKLVLIECRSSILSDVRPQITYIKFECPSCGTIIGVNQIDARLREPSRCSCGRRGGFKEIARNLQDRARVELEDLQDLTETPHIKSMKGFVHKHLTNSEELAKINPGNEVKVLAIFKSVDLAFKGQRTTALDVFLEILEVEPFEQRIDISDFTEEEIEEHKVISEEIIKTNSLKELEKSFCPDVVGNEYPKRSFILKAAQGQGRENKSNVLLIGPPGVAKSVMLKKYNQIIPGSTYISGAGSSAVGLTATAEKKDDGWVLKPGCLVTTKEDVLLDEFNLSGEDELPKLQEAMSEGQITINKASIHAKLKARCGIIAGANPIGGVFNPMIDLVKQFNIPIPILNRFDSIFVIADPKDAEVDKQIALSIIKRESNKLKQKYSDDVLKRYFLFVRSQPEPIFPEDLEDYIPLKYSEIRTKNRKKADGKIINPRFVMAIIRFSKSMAKLKLNSEVSEQDVDFAIDLLKNTYLKWENVGGLA